APEQGEGDAHPAQPALRDRTGAPGGGAIVGPAQPGEERRSVRQDSHVQLQGEPGHRSSHRADAPLARPGARRPTRRAHRRARRRRAEPPAGRRRVVTTWGDLLVHAEARLRATHVLRPEREARWMVESLSGYDGAELLVNEGEAALPLAVRRLDAM